MKKLNINSRISTTLTQRGAEILNEQNEYLKSLLASTDIKFKTYKAGDTYNGQLWEIMKTFGKYCSLVDAVPFVNCEILINEEDLQDTIEVE